MPISSITHLLVHTVSIYRESEESVGRGRWRDNLVVLAANIRGRIFTASGTEVIIGQERKTFNGPVGYLEPTQEIAPRDYIERDGVYYRVLAVLPPSLPHHQKVLLERIELAVM